MNVTLRIAIVLAFVVSMPSCGTPDGPGGETATVRQASESCTVAGDCDDGLLCTLDKCEQLVCTHKAIAGCCAIAADCDDHNTCTADECTASHECKNTRSAS